MNVGSLAPSRSRWTPFHPASDKSPTGRWVSDSNTLGASAGCKAKRTPPDLPKSGSLLGTESSMFFSPPASPPQLSSNVHEGFLIICVYASEGKLRVEEGEAQRGDLSEVMWHTARKRSPLAARCMAFWASQSSV